MIPDSPYPSVVIKVGGSLFDLPDLSVRLQSLLSRRKSDGVILVPGGGPTADLVRAWDRTFHLGEEKSHWLALRALTLNAHFLAALLPRAKVVDRLEEAGRVASGCPVLDMYSWALADESSADHLPHCWQVTSDSLAARLAVKAGAADLLLLKSVDFSGDDWRGAAAAGIVDPYFPVIMDRMKTALRVQVVNLRTRQAT